MNKSRLAIILALVLVIASCAIVKLPSIAVSEDVIWLDQGWSDADREFFHYASQGSPALPFPYDWMLALEQPTASAREVGLLFDTAFLAKLGFLSGEKIAGTNPDGLPIGFTIEHDFYDPATGETFDALGLTCAACHTGRLTYEGREVRYDGAGSLINLRKFTESVGTSMVLTQTLPRRFERFATRVLGPEHTKAESRFLKSELKMRTAYLLYLLELDKAASPECCTKNRASCDEEEIMHCAVEQGFGRLDALTAIGNKVFAVNIGRPENYEPVRAPVDFPYLWRASWLDWVQYDGSIMQPMVRNAGEALGLGATIHMKSGPIQFESSVNFENLLKIEHLLAGEKNPLAERSFESGLQSPRWPEEILGGIDQVLASEGQELYKKHCQNCHLPVLDSEEIWDEQYWTELDGHKYLKLKVVHVGTDPRQAEILGKRTVDTTGMGLSTSVCVYDKDAKKNGTSESSIVEVKDAPNLRFPLALAGIVEEMVHYWYEKHDVPKDKQAAYDGYRPNCVQAMQNDKADYHARPLDGIWATAPYLHNGSVPTLYDMLLPPEDRPKSFFLGNPEFDPVKVGYRTEAFKGGFELDTSIPGNSNAGHYFPVIKTERQRLALLEYLKTL